MNKKVANKRITIKDVARYAQVSPATVSYVMNNSANISPKLKTEF
jgi:DNA-binding LacI/PurR family transcriptional regulator